MSSSASAFSSSDQAVLERETEDYQTNMSLEEIWNSTHKKVSSGWVKHNSYKRICMQFPDDLLPYSVTIRDSLKALISSEAQIFILADTSYGSCCVDEIAAAHVEADCIIHFGNACRSKVSRLPVLYLLPHLSFDLEECTKKLESIRNSIANNIVCIYLDIGYHHLLDLNEEEVDVALLSNKVKESLGCKELVIETYPMPPEDVKAENECTEERIGIFIGGDNNRFSNLSLTTKALKWFIYNPVEKTLEEANPLTTKYMRKRYYYIEKCKDAKMLGLIVATLTADGYLDIIARIQEMAKCRGIQTKIISVGRINPAKLANFIEIDCFILIGCPYNNMYNEKEYYKPIVSVFEAEMALNPAWLQKYPESYVTDFKQLLPEGKSFLVFESDKIEQQDVSLVNGQMRTINIGESNDIENSSQLAAQQNSLASGPKMAIMTSTGLTFEDRSWKGLDPALGLTEVAKIQKGLSGIPIKYTHD